MVLECPGSLCPGPESLSLRLLCKASCGLVKASPAEHNPAYNTHLSKERWKEKGTKNGTYSL